MGVFKGTARGAFRGEGTNPRFDRGRSAGRAASADPPGPGELHGPGHRVAGGPGAEPAFEVRGFAPFQHGCCWLKHVLTIFDLIVV